MASQVILKKSSVAARVPVVGDLAFGELALNYADGLLYYKKSDGTTIGSLGSGSTSTYTRTSFTATAAQTVFTVTYTVGYIQVYYNGVLQPSAEYTATNGTSITLTTAAVINDLIEIIAYTTSTIGTLGPTTVTGIISGGGNQINNVIIGASTPLAGSFTTVSATGQLTLNTSAGSNVDFQNGGGVSLGRIFNDAGYLNLQASANVNGLRLEAPAHVFGRVNGVTITDTSSTGLAVTGVTSSTFGYQLGNGYQINWGGAYGAGIPTIEASSAYGFKLYPTGSTSGAQMHLDSSGNLGLGVTPSAWGTGNKALQLSSYTALAQRTGTSDLILSWNAVVSATGSSSGAGYSYRNTGDIASSYEQNGIHRWYTAPSGTAGAAIAFTQAMTLDASGNLLVGNTSAGGAKVNVLGNGGSIGLSVNPNAANKSTLELITLNNDTTSAGIYVYSTVNSNFNFRVWSNGNTQNTNNSYGAISDLKLKENIIDATPKLAGINQVRIVNYNLIGEENKQIGVIAQELEQIFPGMVDESPDRDKEGNDLGTYTKSVKYSVFVPMLIKAIQEQQALIVTQQATLELLTTRLTALETK